LEIIGEAAKGVPEDIRQSHPHVPWKEMAGTRDKVIHFYFGVNYDIVWSISRDELPGLSHKLCKSNSHYNRSSKSIAI